MYSFKYANKLLPTQTMKQLYYIHVYPHLIGNISIWGTNDRKKTYMQPLIRAHKKIIRLIANRHPRTHTTPIMNKHHILNLNNLYTLRVCAEMHPFIHPQTQLNRPEHDHIYTLTSDVHSHNTRYAAQHHQFIANKKYSQVRKPAHTDEYLTAGYKRVWNSIPSNLRTIKSLKSFKRALKEHLLDEQAKL